MRRSLNPRSPACATFIFAAIILLAALLRLTAMHDAPPGLQHDEMFKALEGRRLAEAGDFRVFYPTNQGHEGGYVWALGASMTLLGVNALAIKFPAFVFGLLTVALTIRVAGVTAGRRAALFAGALCAVSFFAVFTSRVGLRAVMLPVFTLWLTLALHALLRGGHTTDSRRVWRSAVNAGLALGLSIYTYTSAFALWGGVAALIAALALFNRPTLRRVWLPLALAGGIGLVVSVPMIVARTTSPEGFNRSSTITRPLNDALAGRPAELIENGVKLLGMPAFTGDPEARYNVPGRPLFPLPVGLLAYAGLGYLLWHVRGRPVYAALLGTAAVGLLPSLLTVSAPSFLRSIAALPVLYIGVALAANRLPGRAGWIVGLATVALTGILDNYAYFVEWSARPDVATIYRDDLEQLAQTVKERGGRWTVSTPDVEQDSLLFSLYAGEDSARVGFFDGDMTIALIDGDLLAISPLAPLTPPHEPFASETYGTLPAHDVVGQDGNAAFEVYRIDLSDEARARFDEAGAAGAYMWADNAFENGALETWAAPASYPINFGDVLTLAGVELDDRPVGREFDGVNLQLYLRPSAGPVNAPLSVFAHVYRQSNGRLHAQRDLMGMPASQWLSDAMIVQDNFVVMGRSRPGWYVVAVGVYNVVTHERLPVLAEDGTVLGDRVLIGRIYVEE